MGTEWTFFAGTGLMRQAFESTSNTRLDMNVSLQVLRQTWRGDVTEDSRWLERPVLYRLSDLANIGNHSLGMNELGREVTLNQLRPHPIV